MFNETPSEYNDDLEKTMQTKYMERSMAQERKQGHKPLKHTAGGPLSETFDYSKMSGSKKGQI